MVKDFFSMDGCGLFGFDDQIWTLNTSGNGKSCKREGKWNSDPAFITHRKSCWTESALNIESQGPRKDHFVPSVAFSDCIL